MNNWNFRILDRTEDSKRRAPFFRTSVDVMDREVQTSDLSLGLSGDSSTLYYTDACLYFSSLHDLLHLYFLINCLSTLSKKSNH